MSKIMAYIETLHVAGIELGTLCFFNILIINSMWMAKGNFLLKTSMSVDVIFIKKVPLNDKWSAEIF